MACRAKDKAPQCPSQPSTLETREPGLFPGLLLSAPAQHWAGQNVSARVPWGLPSLGTWPEPQDGGACPSPGFLWPLLSGFHWDRHKGWAEAVLGRVAAARDSLSLQSPDSSLNPHSWSQAGKGRSVAQGLRSAQWPRRLPACPLRGWDLPSCPAVSLLTRQPALPLHPLVLASHSAWGARHGARPRAMAESRGGGPPLVEFRPWKAVSGINQT